MANDGSSGSHGTEERMVSGGLGDINIASIFLLPLKVQCHLVCRFKQFGIMRNDDIVFPKDNVAQPDGASPTGAWHFEVFTAAHGEEETQEIILLEGCHEGTGRSTGAHVENLVNGNAFLVASAAVQVLEAPMKVVQQEGLLPHCI